MEDQVYDLSDSVNDLERMTIDAVSFEELLGHCLAVFHSNRDGIAKLEQHLAKYGYQPLAPLADGEEGAGSRCCAGGCGD